MLIENLTQTDITAQQARLIAETFLLDHLGDQLTAGEPWSAQSAISRAWVAPILLTRSAYGPVGAVGVIVIDAATGQVIAATPTYIMQEQADLLLSAQQSELDTALQKLVATRP